jgi:hypothetical protein
VAVTIPQEALARIEARLQSLRPGEQAEIVLGILAFRHKGGKLDVRTRLDLDERYNSCVQLPISLDP